MHVVNLYMGDWLKHKRMSHKVSSIWTKIVNGVFFGKYLKSRDEEPISTCVSPNTIVRKV